jgi:hypothetical protein
VRRAWPFARRSSGQGRSASSRAADQRDRGVLALLPLALSGSGLYSPLAWVIIGGLISSTFLSRVVTPVMYLLLVKNAPPVEKIANAPPAAAGDIRPAGWRARCNGLAGGGDVGFERPFAERRRHGQWQGPDP